MTSQSLFVRSIRPWLWCAVVACACGSRLGAAEPEAPPQPDSIAFYEGKIRPLLAEHCYACHSQQAKKIDKLKGKLLLDSRAGWLQGGDTGPAIVPGQPERSLLVRAISYSDPDLEMPPPAKLDDAEIELLRLWIEHGAVGPAEDDKATK